MEGESDDDAIRRITAQIGDLHGDGRDEGQEEESRPPWQFRLRSLLTSVLALGVTLGVLVQYNRLDDEEKWLWQYLATCCGIPALFIAALVILIVALNRPPRL